LAALDRGKMAASSSTPATAAARSGDSEDSRVIRMKCERGPADPRLSAPIRSRPAARSCRTTARVARRAAGW
jgi:hypothetical protein